MYFLFFLWILTLFFFGKFYFCKKNHPQFFFKSIFSFWKKQKISKNFFKKIGTLKFFSSFGFIVKKTVSDQKTENKLFLLSNPLTLKEFKTIKQIIVSCFSFYCFFYFLFGSITWKNSFLSFLFFTILFILPDLFLQLQKERKEKILESEVPYFIDLLSLTLETGLNIEKALYFITQEKNQSLSKIIRKKLTNLNYGISLEKILEDLKKIIPGEEFKNFISSISQSKKLGVSLSYTLEIQSELIRTRRKQKAEEISRTAAVKISLPLVLFIFPALLLLYIGPGILHLIQK